MKTYTFHDVLDVIKPGERYENVNTKAALHSINMDDDCELSFVVINNTAVVRVVNADGNVFKKKMPVIARKVATISLKPDTGFIHAKISSDVGYLDKIALCDKDDDSVWCRLYDITTIYLTDEDYDKLPSIRKI